FNDEGTLTITNSTISGNTAICGGGIYNDSTLTITNSTISGNTASDAGGICNDGTLTITNSTISENTASGGGGIENEGTLTITNSTISGNTAYYGEGGGIYNWSGMLTITNSTISGNTASYYGGGIFNDGGTLTITNSTISGNTAVWGGGIYGDGGGICNYGTLTLTNTIISLNYAGNCNDVYGSYSGSNNIVGSDPGFVVAPVFDESGVLTNANTLDLSLAAGSAAIDAGTNDAVETEFDIAGNPRIVGGVVDIGAHEYVGSLTPLGAPVITSGSRGIYISCGANRHYLQWGAVAGASGYEVQYSTGGSSWTSVSTTGTGAVIAGLTYGADVTYRVRALGTGSYTDSAWSGTKTFNVCPMDVNGDGDISGGDRSIVALMWLAEDGDDNYQSYADINGDGEISGPDRQFIGGNWTKEAGDADLLYPRALRAADAAFAEYASAEPDVDSDLF
ncbi:MAG: right-handed parallel beta-helix repeat-containing protein, partial [Thermoguttaceae bacterium]|nr:right-handed parallel beta-helix repeat-containing protein [Thermoguttaceae bacterium]